MPQNTQSIINAFTASKSGSRRVMDGGVFMASYVLPITRWHSGNTRKIRLRQHEDRFRHLPGVFVPKSGMEKLQLLTVREARIPEKGLDVLVAVAHRQLCFVMRIHVFPPSIREKNQRCFRQADKSQQKTWLLCRWGMDQRSAPSFWPF